MIVKITDKIQHEWSAVCSQFGVEPETVREQTFYGIDGDSSYHIRHYFVEDEHMARWIKIIKPRWIDNGSLES